MTQPTCVGMVSSTKYYSMSQLNCGVVRAPRAGTAVPARCFAQHKPGWGHSTRPQLPVSHLTRARAEHADLEPQLSAILMRSLASPCTTHNTHTQYTLAQVESSHAPHFGPSQQLSTLLVARAVISPTPEQVEHECKTPGHATKDGTKQKEVIY